MNFAMKNSTSPAKKPQLANILSSFMCFVVLLGAFLLTAASVANALTVLPKRATLNDNKRTEVIILYNGSNTTKSYSINAVERFMNNENSLVSVKRKEAEQNGLHPLDKRLRFSPRRVTIGPGQQQYIRVMIRRRDIKKNTEYRSHLLIVDETNSLLAKKNKETLAKKNQSQDNEGLSFGLIPRYGISIPVFFRSGEPKGEIEIKEAIIFKEKQENFINLEFDINSKRSFFGKLKITSLDDKKVLAFVSNLAIYPEVKKMNIKLKSQNKLKVGMPIKVTYEDKSYNQKTLYVRNLTLQ